MSNEENTIRLEKVIHAPIEQVFDAWLSVKGIATWMCPGEGVYVPNPEIDARVGGKFNFTMKVGEDLLPHVGEYKKLDRPHLLEFTWKSPGTHELETLVTIELESTGENTQLKLTHQLLPDADSANNHKMGWVRILECLADETKKEISQ